MTSTEQRLIGKLEIWMLAGGYHDGFGSQRWRVRLARLADICKKVGDGSSGWLVVGGETIGWRPVIEQVDRNIAVRSQHCTVDVRATCPVAFVVNQCAWRRLYPSWEIGFLSLSLIRDTPPSHSPHTAQSYLFKLRPFESSNGMYTLYPIPQPNSKPRPLAPVQSTGLNY